MTPDEEIALGTALLAGFEKLWSLYIAAKAGKVTAADATAGLKALTDDIAANNTAIDAEVAEKSP